MPCNSCILTKSLEINSTLKMRLANVLFTFKAYLKIHLIPLIFSETIYMALILQVVFVATNQSLTLHCVDEKLTHKRYNLESFLVSMPVTASTKELSQDKDKLTSKDGNIHLYPSNATVEINTINMKLYGVYKCRYKEKTFNSNEQNWILHF